MKIFIIVIIVFFAMIFTSCNNPLDKTYSAETYENDMQAIRQSDKVTDDDIELLAKYIFVSRLAGNSMKGETYDDILDKIKSIRKTNEDMVSRQKKSEEAKREKFDPLLKVNLIEKGFSKIDNRDCITYTVTFENTSPKNIKTIIGSLSMNDVLEKEIKKISIVLDEKLRTMSKLIQTFTVDYNYSDENDQRIRSKNLGDMKIEWNPEKIIFEDGKLAE